MNISLPSTLLLAVALASSARAAPTLSLSTSYTSHPVQSGDLILVTVQISDISSVQVAGFQAFLFDPGEITFLSADYTPSPFGQHIITPISAVAGEIDVAAGIDQITGQPPTSMQALLVTLRFESVNGGCVDSIGFRSHSPPTRITDPVGNEILPLSLIVRPSPQCPGDVTEDGVVNVFDLLLVLDRWGPDGGCGAADINRDGIVNIFDMLIVLDAWGPCP